jgi:hypothetical protein
MKKNGKNERNGKDERNGKNERNGWINVFIRQKTLRQNHTPLF